MATTVFWFRRDLRLADNPALVAAVDEAGADGVVALFVLDDVLRRPAGANRLAFLHRSLRALDEQLDGRLVVRTGDPRTVVPAVAAEAGAGAVFAAADYGPYGRRRDAAVADALTTAGRRWQPEGSPYAVAPGAVTKGDGSPFKVFTPFLRAWSATGWPAPVAAPARPRWHRLPSDDLPPDPATEAELPPAGEDAALARWHAFREDGLARYADLRNDPGADASSRLSPYLKWGALHPRQLLDGLGAGRGARSFRSELAWREFYADVLWHHPESTRHPLQPAMRAMEVDEGPDADARFRAWAEGRTGFPIVDAGMRQLLHEGWMHNRVRMITASFLVKDLHLDWRRGARHFARHLIDGDVASNTHGWQWVAGTGTDPAPYFRVFNPILQGRRFDPEEAYVRRYVPELGTEDYPAPVVDHAAERREALTRYDAVRRGHA